MCYIFVLFSIFAVTSLSQAMTEFKSYNEWCYTKKMTMKVTLEGCRHKVIQNNYCYGQCNSFYLPSATQLNAFGAGRPTIRCYACSPSKKTKVKISLSCPRRRNLLHTRIKYRQVVIVNKCSCKRTLCNYDNDPLWRK